MKKNNTTISTVTTIVDQSPQSNEILVSRYSNFKDRKSQREVNLFTFFDNPGLQDCVKYVQSFYSSDKERYNKEKAILPCITPSGRFSSRKASELIEHSGYMCIDIDAGDNPGVKDFAELRDEISKIVNVAYCSLSLSGNGVFCFIPIMYPEKHKEHFNELRNCFEEIGIIIDKACSDVSRLRAASYDENRYINRNAVVFEGLLDEKIHKRKPVSKRASKSGIQSASKNYDASKTFNRVKDIVFKLVTNHIDITDAYDDWFRIGCSLASEFGEDGRDFFHDVSMQSSKYNDMQTDTMYNSCLNGKRDKGGVTIGTFFHLAKQYI